ncbi:ATP-dependent nuclease [Liquorilactobacillus nagelii]|jgi:predicted ATP-dependent endonuclease of OLD family|uniref:ATP-dependent nuclease n=1 Tax=Liquorilactobacillus nagelii TaxID=82688 RepID=UPI00242EA0E9|nr:AAA family ATPase [Liquorilactobacillus nagelii]MCI1699183.1 AAA family ATPase [Liquorilactobacillus nagelii]
MKLVKMMIEGFRSYGEKTTVRFGELTTLIGDNGVGKTTALIVLNKMFSAHASDRIIKTSDFYSPIEENLVTADQKQMLCDVYFQLDSGDDRAQAELLSHVCVANPQGELILHVQLSANWVNDGSAEGAIESKIYFVIDDSNPDDIKEREAPRRELNLIRMIYVPAVRNPEKQLGATSNSLLARLVHSVNWNPETKKNIEDQLSELNQSVLGENGLKRINKTLSTDWQKYYQDKRFANVALTIDSTNLSSLANRIQSTFTSQATGRNFRPEEMGDGTRSLFYISNVASVLDIEQSILEDENNQKEPLIDHHPPLLTLVAIEEPENHISPHLLGKLVGRLKNMAELANCQVLLTSHSPAIISRISPESIRYVRLDPHEGTSTIQSLNLPNKENTVEAYRYVKLAVQVYPELYFAQLVVLGEGASEEIIVPHFLEASGDHLDENGIAFVPLAGRFVHYLWNLLNQLGIPFITLLDLDRERTGGGWGRVSYILGELKMIDCKVEKLPSGIEEINDDALKDLSKKLIENKDDANELDNYLKNLERKHVYFSNPLDIDFLMLTHYSDEYKHLIKGNEGPIIKKPDGQQTKAQEYEPDNVSDEIYVERAEEATKSALKGGVHVTAGDSYSSSEKALMIWYVYFFLGRGKPTTHIQVLDGDEDGSKLTKEKLLKNIPPVIKRLCTDVSTQLNIGAESHD